MFERVRRRGATSLGALALVACAAGAAAQSSAVPSTFMSFGRLLASIGALLALIGVVVGGRALARARGGAHAQQRAAIVAQGAGLLGAALGAVVVISEKGGVGSGNGRGGAIVAIVLGTIAVIVALAARARRGRAE